MLHRPSIRHLFRNPCHQTAADHERHQDGKKESQFQIVRHAFLRVGRDASVRGAGTPNPFASITLSSMLRFPVPGGRRGCGAVIRGLAFEGLEEG
jgi:hypothetical protein